MYVRCCRSIVPTELLFSYEIRQLLTTCHIIFYPLEMHYIPLVKSPCCKAQHHLILCQVQYGVGAQTLQTLQNTYICRN